MNKLTEMEAFTTVVDQGGFTGAARALGISKSAVSKHVSSLEGRLGVRLLSRTTRRVDPTDLGMLYYERARQILSAARDADHLVSTITSEVEGNLRVALMDECASRIAALHVPGFLGDYGGVTLTLEQVTTPMDPLANGYDVFVRTGQQPDGDVRAQRLCDVEFALVASPEYLKIHGDVARIEDLSSRDLLEILASDGTGNLVLQSRAREDRRVYAPGRLVTRDSRLLLDAACQGLGIAYLPLFMVEPEIAAGQLSRVLSALPPQTAQVYAACSPVNVLTAKINAFIDHLVSACEIGSDPTPA